MKVGLMQPYFLPYVGYYQLISAVDKYVIYDDVNYIKSGWVNRNQYLERDKAKLFNLNLDGASSFKKINEININDNGTLKMRSKILKTLKQNYIKAPFYFEVIDTIEEVIMYPEQNLAKYIEFSLRKLCDKLKINTDIIVSSHLPNTSQFKGEERVIAICEKLGATIYINAIGGKELYSTESFRKRNIELLFLRTNPSINYEQYNDEFIPYLSILDVLMFNGFNGTMELLNQYTLEE